MEIKFDFGNGESFKNEVRKIVREELSRVVITLPETVVKAPAIVKKEEDESELKKEHDRQARAIERHNKINEEDHYVI